MAQPCSNVQFCLQFRQRRRCCREELKILFEMPPRLAFGNIGRNGNGRPAQLIGESIHFVLRKTPRQAVDLLDKVHTVVPNPKITKPATSQNLSSKPQHSQPPTISTRNPTSEIRNPSSRNPKSEIRHPKSFFPKPDILLFKPCFR